MICINRVSILGVPKYTVHTIESPKPTETTPFYSDLYNSITFCDEIHEYEVLIRLGGDCK